MLYFVYFLHICLVSIKMKIGYLCNIRAQRNVFCHPRGWRNLSIATTTLFTRVKHIIFPTRAMQSIVDEWMSRWAVFQHILRSHKAICKLFCGCCSKYNTDACKFGQTKLSSVGKLNQLFCKPFLSLTICALQL